MFYYICLDINNNKLVMTENEYNNEYIKLTFIPFGSELNENDKDLSVFSGISDDIMSKIKINISYDKSIKVEEIDDYIEENKYEIVYILEKLYNNEYTRLVEEYINYVVEYEDIYYLSEKIFNNIQLNIQKKVYHRINKWFLYV